MPYFMVCQPDPSCRNVSSEIGYEDTRKHGKPNMVKLIHHVVDEYQPEVVCVISNNSFTRRIVYGLRSRGILTLGAIFDS